MTAERRSGPLQCGQAKNAPGWRRGQHLVTASRAEVAATPLWTVDVLGFNHDAGLGSVLGIRRLTGDGDGAGPMVTALMEAIETPTGDAATIALGDTICRVDVAKSTAAPLLSPSAATGVPSTTVPRTLLYYKSSSRQGGTTSSVTHRRDFTSSGRRTLLALFPPYVV